MSEPVCISVNQVAKFYACSNLALNQPQFFRRHSIDGICTSMRNGSVIPLSASGCELIWSVGQEALSVDEEIDQLKSEYKWWLKKLKTKESTIFCERQ